MRTFPVSRLVLTVLMAAFLAGPVDTVSQSNNSAYVPSAANLAARQWFQDAKFGLFVHWGVYSVLGEGE